MTPCGTDCLAAVAAAAPPCPGAVAQHSLARAPCRPVVPRPWFAVPRGGRAPLNLLRLEGSVLHSTQVEIVVVLV